jgi:hypothetical protein
MNQESDRRMWSTTPRRLIALVEALLNRGMPETMMVREAPPDAFFTYHSAQTVIDIETIVLQACQYAARMLTSRRPELANEDLAPLIYDGIRIWVDFLFIDQSARDIREELAVLPRLLEGARAHFVLGTKPLMRAWCCYEIALFNQHLVGADVSRFAGLPGAQLRSFIAPTRSFHLGWERTETTAVEAWYARSASL